jgi:hypothetical protein
MALCLAIDVTTHWGDRMDTLRLFIPVWATFAWSWGVRVYFQGQLTPPCPTPRLSALHPRSVRFQKVG